MGPPNIQMGDIPSPYELRKIVIDYRNLPICVDHIIETGTIRKKCVYYHNYGWHTDIVIVTIPFRGEPKVKKYTFRTSERKRLPKVKHPKGNVHQYVS